MEKRNLFDKVFKKRPSVAQTTDLRMMNGYNAIYTRVGDDIYNCKIARQCIDRIAQHASKFEPQHIQDNLSHVINGDIHYLLNKRPNPLMSTHDFLYKVVSLLFSDENAFVFIEKDSKGFITGFYPVLATNYRLFQSKNNIIYLKFTFINGQDYMLPYVDLIHLRRFYNRNDIFGTSDEILKTDLQSVKTAAEGTQNAIKISTSLRGILKYINSNIKEKDLIENKQKFVNDYLNLENESGIAALDGKADFIPLEMRPIALDSDQVNRLNQNVFDYFGVSEKIITNSYTYQEYNAFYEGILEPLAIQLSQEFTAKIFTIDAIKEGHQIVFTTNLLMYAPLETKVELIKNLASYGMVKVDEVRELLGLLPLGGVDGDRILQSLNSIDTSIANEYQLSSKKKN